MLLEYEHLGTTSLSRKRKKIAWLNASCKLPRTTNNSSGRSLRDFSYCRTAVINELCQEDYVQASISPLEETGKLFCNEAACRTYRNFREFEVHEGTENSILLVASLDAIMATIVDSLVDEQRMTSSTSIKYCNATADAEKSCTASDDIAVQYKMTRKSRAGRAPVENIRKVKSYLSHVFRQLSPFFIRISSTDDRLWL